MELAVIISLIALAVALPSCISDSLIVISKVRAYYKKRQRTRLQKKSLSGIPNTQKVPLARPTLASLKKITLFHLQDSVRAARLIVIAIILFALVSFLLPTTFAPTERTNIVRLQKDKYEIANAHFREAMELFKQVNRRSDVKITFGYRKFHTPTRYE